MENQEENYKSLACESCGKKFFCGAENGVCWCFDLTLKPETLAELKTKYKNCLCADCLKDKTELLSAE